MTKKLETTGKIAIKYPGTNKSWFTMRFINFDSENHFIGSPEAKEMFRKELHVSKAQLKDNYICIYAAKNVVGRGKNRHIEFTTCVERKAMKGADIIFVVPTKVKKDAFKVIKNLQLPI